MKRNIRVPLAGALAGVINGLFGGGGGMAVLPLLGAALPQRQLFATCVAIIFPLCAVSALFALPADPLPLLKTALPYLLGGLGGGVVGGLTFQKVDVKWLRRIFAAFLLYGGVRYLL